MQHTICILARILCFPQTWDTALQAGVVTLLTAKMKESLSGQSLWTQISTACALASITGAEGGKHTAVQAGVVPLLVGTLALPSRDLVKMAVRALRNIASVDSGRQAAYAAHAVKPLVAILDSRPQADDQVRYDAVKTLSYIASIGKVARKTIREQGAVKKLKALSNIPVELRLAADGLRDDLRTWS